jgi:hypothetical protein
VSWRLRRRGELCRLGGHHQLEMTNMNRNKVVVESIFLGQDKE